MLTFLFVASSSSSFFLPALARNYVQRIMYFTCQGLGGGGVALAG
jgi:hypothetical protein